ncbi:formate dehydrogenase [Coccomyxa subellipsoidea C-169]|uniref:formate dehydrogenase n=1 Tax=Coccomyxa subellipsoidea (strain C-169) TaxID=574566 RepID=I0YQ52_COCSC|nr:formate dehydrogenase [Coccomyxa subellipsoidea C-169]EIE20521.1 formate dehydrogenase [Coccomyxa subellipsoidea C-169]|eukprot:XP_005645065.1 formate dehydrogenase [Coccomyxa subellipsoidea C-169]
MTVRTQLLNPFMRMPCMKKKIVAVLPKGGPAADNPKYLNCVENGLGLREWLEESGHTFIATADKEGSDSELQKNLSDANAIITTPFHPAYMTKELISNASNLELILTAGVGSDHIDLKAAADKGITVAEVTGSNVESVAEDEVMRMLILMRNFVPGYLQAINDEWDVPAIGVKAWDIKGKTVGTVGGGRIAYEVMKRLEPWGVTRLYFDREQKPDKFDDMGVTWEKDLDSLLSKCDIVTVNVPLTDSTKGMFNKEVIGKMKEGAFLINNARGAVVDPEAVEEALKSGQLGGYAGDVWPEQPAPKDHPWRHMPNHAMTPHISGTTLDAQERYAGGVRDMLEAWIEEKPFEEDYYIVREGELASQYQ